MGREGKEKEKRRGKEKCRKRKQTSALSWHSYFSTLDKFYRRVTEWRLCPDKTKLVRFAKKNVRRGVWGTCPPVRS